MILRVNRRDSYSFMVRSMTNKAKELNLNHKSNKLVGSSSGKNDITHEKQEPAQKSPNFSSKTAKKHKETKPAIISTSELAKIRALQYRDNLRLEKKQLYQKLALSSYLHVCVDVGQINRAFNTLLSCSSPKKNSLVDVHHYNIVLKGWAKLNSNAQIVETRMHMIRNNIEPNAETFAYILLSNSNKSSKQSTTKKIIQEMKARDVDPRTLFQAAYLNSNERKIIRTLMRHVDPKYDDTFCPEPVEDGCKLTEGVKGLEVVPDPFAGTINLSRLPDWADTQRITEWKSSITIKSIAKADIKPKIQEQYAKSWDKFQELWRKAINKSLDESFVALQDQCTLTDKIHIYPYLCSIDRSMMVHLILDEIENSAKLSSFSLSTSYLHLQFGHKVMNRYIKAKALSDGSHQEKQKIYTDYLKEYCKNPSVMGKMNSREFIQQKALETKNYAIYKDRLSPVEEWPHHVIASVGKFLYGIILKEVKFDPSSIKSGKKDINPNNLIHAFYTAYFQIDSSHKIKEEFRAHREFEKFYLKACAHRLKFDYSQLPSLTPPMPWLSHGFGGYLTNKTELVRISNPSAEQTFLTRENTNYQKLYPTLDSLNAVGLCPWIVNKEVLDLVIDLFKAGGDVELAVPLHESKMEIETPVLDEDASKADRILYNRAKKKYDQKRREMYSLWRDCLYRLSIADHFRDKVFWFPHNVDFRGRAYPIPPHFNHLGADLARSLLLFAKGKPLGEKGLDWLKIHLINLEGKMKKASLDERLEYANSILHLEVLDSADNPWDGRKWWTKNENPWQVLACCKEIAKAIRSRDFREYVSHLPVHQDGSCNGLQHYAALGRDTGGAIAVNLVPSQRPQDVYSRVVDIVERMRKEDAANGVKAAEKLEGYIERKVIKQTVMTIVYGVTRYGARQQIARQLAYKGYPDTEIWSAAQYLTGKTFESIGQMFNKSRLIQDWLNDCAYTIASRYKQPVSWETPLGFYVVQPYTMPNAKTITKSLSSSLSGDQFLYNDPLARLNTPKQKSAFPPNYIHSLDSSHMMLTSLYCQRKGITFVSVHDCYWTHPSTVDIMNRVCREQFVALHSEPLLKQLSEQFIRKFEQNEGSSESEISKRLGGNKSKHMIGIDETFSMWENENKNLGKDQSLNLSSHLDGDSNASVSSLLISMPIYEDDKLVNEDLKQLMQEEVYNIANKVVNESHKNIDEGTLEGATKGANISNKNTLAEMYKSSRQASKSQAKAIFSQVPKTGDLDLNTVLESKYFFS